MRNVFLVLIFFLTSCSSIIQEKKYGQINLDSGSFITYIKYNDDYLVTVKHGGSVPFLSYESKEYDIIFIKRKNENIVKWNNVSNKEKLIAVGYNKRKSLIEKEIILHDTGIIMDIGLKEKGYRFARGKIEKGMSGGPLINNKKEIVGMIIGYTKYKIELDGIEDYYTIYAPLNVIEKEFEKLGLN